MCQLKGFFLPKNSLFAQVQFDVFCIPLICFSELFSQFFPILQAIYLSEHHAAFLSLLDFILLLHVALPCVLCKKHSLAASFLQESLSVSC